MHRFKQLFSIVFSMLFIVQLTAQDTTQQIIKGRTNSKFAQKKPYVILISADGFRYDLADKYHATHLQALRSQGVEAAYMKPSYPSVTFPNHYTIVTGLYPSHHGLVDNSFLDQQKGQYSMGNKKAVADSSWYGGTPLWVLAEQQQLLSSSFYWVASESAIQGVHPTYYYIYNEKISINKRIAQVKAWLELPEDKRPHLITFYFPEVDHAEHLYGTQSKETEAAVHFVDESVGKMVAAVDSLNLPVNFIFLSDHGMADVDVDHTLPLPEAIDTAKFFIPRGDVLLHLYAKDKADIQSTYLKLKASAVDYDVFLANEVPVRWHYGKADDKYNRIGDIILVPHFPKVFNLGNRKTTPGKHGFDNDVTEMRASFYAWGPAFKKQLKIDGFENVHVYPLVARILGLKIDEKNIDGKLKVLQPILQ